MPTSMTITRSPVTDPTRPAQPRTDASRTALDPLAPPSPLVEWALETARRTPGFGTDPGATLAWCVDVGKRAPQAGEGRTRELWDLLAAVAALDVSAARMLEPHLDALAILRARGVPIEVGPFPARPTRRANFAVHDNAGNVIFFLGHYAK